MECIKFYPLVSGGDKDKIPMLACRNEKTVAENHGLYLAEVVPHHYRLYARKAHSRSAHSAYIIHCPTCGHAMKAITDSVDAHKLALYVCPECR